ncbi:ammonium transporter [Haliangium sp.]|uniref:ammonium transporter n=1 Tax=Haliangium sp. TaxID=2663208 RepID=UPI003D0DB8CE
MRILSRASLRWSVGAAGAGVLLVPALAWAQDTSGADISNTLDLLWVLIAASLVFFMQAGFLAFEVGAVRRKNTAATAMKNLGDWVMMNLVFFLVGYGLMFGASQTGIIGTDLFFGTGLGTGESLTSRWEWTRLLYQLAFAGTAATIVSGAMAERTTFKAYILFTVALGGVIYPLYGHWVWNPNGWLAQLGYMDFAGSSVVHMVGATAALVGVRMVGPRLGRYSRDGSMTKLEINSSAWSALGVVILWFGWWGFNGGSTMSFSSEVVPIIVNTNIAGATAAMLGFFHCQAFQGGAHIEEKFMGSALGGLVAITAGCNVVTPVGAFVIGVGAAVIHNYSYELILGRLHLDDVVAASPVHGFCGAWGILMIPFLAREGTLAAGNVISQLGVQALGAVVCVAWTAVTAFAFLKIIHAVVGLRVSPIREIRGLGIGEDAHVERADPELDQILADSGTYIPSTQDIQEGLRSGDY